ncbi:MAG: hypothetical protein JXK07_10065 [Spirochaetes bacterium]|nr:hypothetical protein [Spirochaetota bacterium]MBN2771257.1 hypothetical protein [Spirochaetota bacterium]
MRKKINTHDIETEPDFDKAGQRPFWHGFFYNKHGRFSKRHFAFSFSMILSFAYAILCMCPALSFDAGLAQYILGLNAAFGLNYYMNEKKPYVQ